MQDNRPNSLTIKRQIIIENRIGWLGSQIVNFNYVFYPPTHFNIMISSMAWNIAVFPKWNRKSVNSANSGNRINYWKMNLGQFKDPVFHMRLAGTVVASRSLKPEAAGFSHWIHWNQCKHLGKTLLCLFFHKPFSLHIRNDYQIVTANKVHISEETKILLNEHGGFTIATRGTVLVKVSCLIFWQLHTFEFFGN